MTNFENWRSRVPLTLLWTPMNYTKFSKRGLFMLERVGVLFVEK